jgi:dTDP-4-amino-4,6-dideoxygalactose transaminase
LATPEAGIQTPREPSWSRAVYHLYVVRTQDREGLVAHLGKAGIGSGIHYPIPLHLQRAYEGLGYKTGDFPVCEKIAAEIISLPMYPQITAEQQARVVRELLHFVKNRTVSKLVSSESDELATSGRTA